MTIKFNFIILVALILLRMPAFAQTSTMNYRGRLTASSSPANGAHDMEFKLFATPDAGSGAQQGATKSIPGVPVTNGVFNVALDFGAVVFDGSPRFLEISIRPSDGGPIPYTTLSPRQQVASIPYAIHSLSAGTATNLANGAAVRSLNNLKDDITLAAGANVNITPAGNTLTIAATGGPWIMKGIDTYYAAGSVGLGVSAITPDMRLEVSGATLLKPGNGNIQFGSPSAELGMSMIPNAGNRADLRFDGSVLKLLAGTGVTPPADSSGLAITTDGTVGIGTVTPAAGYRLEVAGGTVLRPSNGSIQFGSPNAEVGMSITPNAGNRADLRFDGSVLKLLASPGVSPPSAANGLAITTGGNIGIGTTAPDAKLHVEKTEPGTAVYGHALGAGAVGVYGHTPNPGGIGVLGSAGAGSIGVYAGNTAGGTAVYADGNATQKADKGGFVKAMAYIDPFLPQEQRVVRCYTSLEAGGGTSAAPCGIQVRRDGPGSYQILFGFNVETRFISVTMQATYRPDQPQVSGVISRVHGNAVDFGVQRGTESEDSRFHIIIY